MTSEQQRRVLVVDDDAGVRGLLCAVLRGRGLVVDDASDGKEALDLIETRAYGVVLLDLLMPVMNGFDVLGRLERMTPRPVVIVVTGADRSAIESLDAGAIHGVIRKPFDPEELGSVVASCAEIRSRMSLEAMAMALVAGGPILALLNRLPL
jgi:CheY-like chemotaxis protein